ncbi:hypothetical protein [Micromonospora sagamiensis]|uniref:Uncharacterized protein n=1 Tax=Micromonospora sagamiensis TaxID=47875 RepID=A0A562WCK1_9ACTN|nr:hypothetical protein [Micromonospora sagamiensis]TWJ27982.1 hypothetical protein JD81_01485 [Micromonospora sagamiensis]BCL13129.1 hypothetical protein GCM10017556_08680 [Micromonospora sagamiensis]
MTGEPSRPRLSAGGRGPLRRPTSIVASMLLLASWWAYMFAVNVVLLAEAGGAGQWLALAGCTVAVVLVLRGLWRGGPTAWRVVHRFAAPVALAFLGGIGAMLVFGPRLGALITTPVAPATIAAMAGGLLAVLALLVSGLLVRTAPARAWCRG